MVIDLLNHLEWYVGLHPRMQALINLLDRGEVYQQSEGSYQHDEISYTITSLSTSDHGQEATAQSTEVHLLLEGEEIFSLHDRWATRLVTTLTEGQFVLLFAEQHYRHNQSATDQRWIKRAVFSLD